VKVVFDRETDILTITLLDSEIAESDELRPGVIADFDSDGRLARLELLEASARIASPERIDYQAVTFAG
jgi:uncharacterized protein YuzE